MGYAVWKSAIYFHRYLTLQILVYGGLDNKVVVTLGCHIQLIPLYDARMLFSPNIASAISLLPHLWGHRQIAHHQM